MLQRSIMLIMVLNWTLVASAVETGKPAPAWHGTDFSGETVDFPAVVAGKPSVMIFWATWCPYCNAFIPYLGQIQKDYGEDQIKPSVMIFWATWCPYCNAFIPYLGQIQKDYGEDQINIIAINAKERGIGDPAAYVADLDFTVIDVAEGDVIAEKYSVRFIPGLMIVDGNGDLAWKRASTELPAGKTVAELWDGQVREQLDLLLAAD